MARKRTEIIELDAQRVEELLRRAEAHSFETEDYQTIRLLVESYACLTSMLGDKNTTIARLRKLLFGATTEKTDAVVGPSDSPASSAEPEAVAQPAAEGEQNSPRKKGHGRNKADAYAGAEKIEVQHESLRSGDACPDCLEGIVYATAPGVLVRIRGQAPLGAKLYQLQKFRCNLCGEVYTAQAPAGVGSEKYDATAASMIGVLKYGSGLPFNRVERLQKNMEIPLPAATQWEIVKDAAEKMAPAHDELVRQAAQGELVQNDDTAVKILELMGQRAKKRAFLEDSVDGPTNKDGSQRTGLFTSGVVSTGDGQRIALFFSGRQHAGENLRDVLRERSPTLAAPVHMCDALSRNVPGELATIMANCLAHARRNFVEVYDRFPDECRHVLEALKVIYKNDAEARQQKLSPQERLTLHQAESRPVMDELRDWLKKQFDDHLVEPNSPLGSAIAYMLAHWDKLTLFLRQAGAPLDNNLCERVLKKAILHRKNALFYKTQNGARVGDMYMSLIHTCELCGAVAFDYLTELQRHAAQVAAKPAEWMPWNYRQTLGAAQRAA
jgi:transposase